MVEFGNPLLLSELKETYQFNSIIVDRIDRCLENKEKYSIPIESLQLFKKPVAFEELKDIDNKFTVPRCYCLLNKYQKVFDYLEKQEMYDIEFNHIHDRIYEKNICVYCSEMELTEEYKTADMKYRVNKKYDAIKS